MTTTREDCDTDTPPARRTTPDEGKPDQLKDKTDKAENRQEALIDEASEESFPASDPPTPKRIT